MSLDEARGTRVLMAALSNASKAKDKFEKMKKKHEPKRERDPGEPMHPDVAELMTRSLRIDLVFKDPIDTRRQLEVLAAGVVRALAISQDHERGPYRQRRDMREVLRDACVEIQIMQGKKPHLG